MVLEMEIERIAGWVEHRVMPPCVAARALADLMACYVRAGNLNRNLMLFEHFARVLFERQFHSPDQPGLTGRLIERAWRLLDTRPDTAAAQVTLFYVPANGSVRLS